MKKTLFFFCALQIVNITQTGNSNATSFISVPLDNRVYESPVIIRGKTGDSYSDWVKNSDGSRQIFTFTEVAVTEVMKGDVKSSKVIIREMGGEKDGIGLSVPGTAKFKPGEDVVLTLQDSDSSDSYRMQGMSMGKYTVQQDSNGNEYLAGGSLSLERGAKRTTLSELRQKIDHQKKEPAPTLAPGQLKIHHSHSEANESSNLPTASKLHSDHTDDLDHRDSNPTPVGNSFPWIWVILVSAAVAIGGYLISRQK